MLSNVSFNRTNISWLESSLLYIFWMNAKLAFYNWHNRISYSWIPTHLFHNIVVGNDVNNISWLLALPSHSYVLTWFRLVGKVENILKGSLDSIPSPSPSVKIQIMGRKFWVRCKGKSLQNITQQWFALKSFPPIIWIFTEDEGDGIESRLSSFKYFLL